MWEIWEGPKARKALRRLPHEILKRYEKWKDIVHFDGPNGLRYIRGFRDETLKGKWKGYRSSRLNIQFRVIYRVVHQEVYIEVFDINPHEYR